MVEVLGNREITAQEKILEFTGELQRENSVIVGIAALR
jgi:hypothetical protein